MPSGPENVSHPAPFPLLFRIYRKERDDFIALITAAAWNQNPEVTVRVLLEAGAKANLKTGRET
jgi:hypothetical protein